VPADSVGHRHRGPICRRILSPRAYFPGAGAGGSPAFPIAGGRRPGKAAGYQRPPEVQKGIGASTRRAGRAGPKFRPVQVPLRRAGSPALCGTARHRRTCPPDITRLAWLGCCDHRTRRREADPRLSGGCAGHAGHAQAAPSVNAIASAAMMRAVRAHPCWLWSWSLQLPRKDVHEPHRLVESERDRLTVAVRHEAQQRAATRFGREQARKRGWGNPTNRNTRLGAGAHPTDGSAVFSDWPRTGSRTPAA
jgi:hypothetical protein